MKIIIQAGGKGTRLEGLTRNKPKCLVPVNNLPIIFYAFQKFKDADLLGIPVRITVGRGAADGMVEYKLRRDAEKIEITVEEAIEKAVQIVNEEK